MRAITKKQNTRLDVGEDEKAEPGATLSVGCDVLASADPGPWPVLLVFASTYISEIRFIPLVGHTTGSPCPANLSCIAKSSGQKNAACTDVP